MSSNQPNPAPHGPQLPQRTALILVLGMLAAMLTTAAWQWDDVPGHSLLGPGDSPKSPIKVPPGSSRMTSSTG